MSEMSRYAIEGLHGFKKCPPIPRKPEVSSVDMERVRESSGLNSHG
jgi:hypothetical protein